MNESIKEMFHSFTVGDFNERYTNDYEFKRYAQQVYFYFETMQPGAELNLLSYSEKELEWILLTFVAFFLEGPHWLEYYISTDYNAIGRYEITPDFRQREIEQWLKWKNHPNS